MMHLICLPEERLFSKTMVSQYLLFLAIVSVDLCPVEGANENGEKSFYPTPEDLLMSDNEFKK